MGITESKGLKGKIRFASAEDTEAILEIYAPYIENTYVTFEYDVPSVDAFRERIEGIIKKYPWLVYEENGKILGYAYAGPDRTRAAYQWTCESSIYISEEAKGRGIGTALYDELFKILKKQNFCICYALIVDDNVSSIEMHIKKYGFTEAGHLRNTGYKHGAWHGIIELEKILNPPAVPPKPVIPITELDYNIV